MVRELLNNEAFLPSAGDWKCQNMSQLPWCLVQTLVLDCGWSPSHCSIRDLGTHTWMERMRENSSTRAFSQEDKLYGIADSWSLHHLPRIDSSFGYSRVNYATGPEEGRERPAVTLARVSVLLTSISPSVKWD